MSEFEWNFRKASVVGASALAVAGIVASVGVAAADVTPAPEPTSVPCRVAVDIPTKTKVVACGSWSGPTTVTVYSWSDSQAHWVMVWPSVK